MPRKSPPKPDEKPQFDRFIEAAKEIEAAETDEGLADNIRKVAPDKIWSGRKKRTTSPPHK